MNAATEILKSKAKFEEYMENQNPKIVTSILADYATANKQAVIKICDLTQNIDTLLNAISDPTVQNLSKPPFIVWMLTNEKEKIQNLVRLMNIGKGAKTFVFKAILNEDETDIEYECILKPEAIRKSERNDNTKAKLLQNEYWIQYAQKSDRKITPAPRHYQFLSIGKGGVQIAQTVNTAQNYVATEILIRDDKAIYDKLLEHREEIEQKLGTLDWQKNEEKKSSRIRKTIEADITDETKINEIIEAHINMAKDFKTEFAKYL